MAGKKGMNWYPAELRAEVVSKFQAGESQRSLSREYEISRRAIQDWLKEPTVFVHNRDLYDNNIAAYKTATQQTGKLVLDTIRMAMKKEKKSVSAKLQLHSGRGFQFTSQAYFSGLNLTG